MADRSDSDAPSTDAETTRLWRRFVQRVSVLFAVSGVFIFGYNAFNDAGLIDEMALKRARAHYRDIILAWRWNADYGGVYGEVRPGEGRNEYPEFPDLTDIEGKTYRLRHPDQMSRELAEMAKRDGEHQFRITSLKPKNPANEPDPWEREALEKITAGAKEYFGVVAGTERVQFRYMAPMLTEENCLLCHSERVYKIGGIHGGISVSFDITNLTSINRVHQGTMGFVILLTLGFALIATRHFSQRLDARLRHINRRHEELLQTSAGVIWEANPENLHLTFISSGIEELLGFGRKECLESGFWPERIFPDDRAKVTTALATHNDRNNPLHLDYRLLHKDGRAIWVQDAVSLATQEDGQTLLRGVILDISERKIAEGLVNAMLAEQQAVFQNAVVGIAIIRLRHICSCNRRFEEIFGAPADGFIGKSTRLIYLDEETYQETGRRVSERFACGERFREELRLRRLDGSEIWGEMAGQPIDFEHPEQGGIWVFADITARKEALDKAEKLLQAVEHSPVSIIITDRAGVVEYVNPRFEMVTGYRRDEILGQTPRVLKSGQVADEIYRQLWQTIAAGSDWRGQLLNRRKDGELIWEDVSISPIADENNEITHFVAVKEDITERRAAQQALEQHKNQLEELVTARTADLRKALDAAHAADRAKDDFLANVSHEMRTPLNAVIGLSGLAVKHSHDTQITDYLQKINTAGQSLLLIINDLLDLSKIAAGQQDIERVPFRLTDICERLRLLMAHRVEEKGLRFEIILAPELPARVVGDPLRIEQILLNLTGNAVKFTDRGSVTVRLGQWLIEDPIVSDDVGVEIIVEDTGRGMSREETGRLFQPFSQANISIARTHGGTGLGLTICKRLVELMEGTIQAQSAPGIGSRFIARVRLGRASDHAPETNAARVEGVNGVGMDGAAGEPDLTALRYQDTRVLVVDDQPINRQIACELLADVGVASDEADDGRTALEQLTGHPPGYYDLVLMDVQMSEVDGYEATRRLRALPGCEQLPVIAMTAFAMEHERQACYDAGMNDHIGKPFDPDDLLRLLLRWIAPERRVAHTKEAAGNLAQSRTEPAAGIPLVEGIDTAAGLARFAGNKAAYLQWLGNFYHDGKAPFLAVVADLESDRRDQALRALHALKGRCGMLGITELWQAIVELEAHLKRHEDAAAALATVHARFEEVLEELAALPETS